MTKKHEKMIKIEHGQYDETDMTAFRTPYSASKEYGQYDVKNDVKNDEK